jgi:hypothetical protein
MPVHVSFRIAAAALALAVIVRALPFVWWPGVHFDSDQATVGLMATHISEGRAFPLYFYGQHYMLAVEAYLAAPMMWLLGPTVLALKLPLVAINIAVVVLLLRILVRDAGLAPWTAVVAALPLALPAGVLAARTTEAMGGNVEPWLYVLWLWWLRDRPLGFGAVLGLGMLHREFTAYGAVALLVMDGLTLVGASNRRAATAARVRHWALVGVAWVATRALAQSLEPFANALGPGTRGDDPALQLAVVDTLGGRLCFAPDTWATRTTALVSDHLPRLVGGMGAPFRDYGVLSGVFSGQSGLGVWVAAITIAGLASGAWHWQRQRRTHTEPPMPHVAGYLVLVGLISTVVYTFVTCSTIRVETLRYNLLAIFVPVGAVTMAVQTWRQPVVRAGFGAAVGLWCLLNLLDVVALTREYQTRPPVDQRQAVGDALVARGVTVARAPFRTAYHVTFLARERVRIDATDFSRIRAYTGEAVRTNAPTIADGPCADGWPLPSGQFVCPSLPTSAADR